MLFLVSLAANLFSAFSGGGAGLIQLPVLIFLGLPFAIALATQGRQCRVRYRRDHTPLEEERWSVAGDHILAFGLPGVIIGANVILAYRSGRRGGLGLLTGAGDLFRLNPKLGQAVTPTPRSTRDADRGLTLFGIGALNGSLTSGTGLLVTMWLVRWFGLDYRRAIAYTLVLVGVFWNGTGALTLGILGEIRWSWLPALLLGSLLGGYLGAHLAIKSGNRWIKRAFECVTLLVGVKLIVG
jgi:uncharacterized membrane protein YfcA